MRTVSLSSSAVLTCLATLGPTAASGQDIPDACRLFEAPLLDKLGYTAKQDEAVPWSHYFATGEIGNKLPFHYGACFHAAESFAYALGAALNGGKREQRDPADGPPDERGAALMVQTYSMLDALSRQPPGESRASTEASAGGDKDDDVKEVAALAFYGGNCITLEKAELALNGIPAQTEITCFLDKGRHEVSLSVFDTQPKRLPSMQQIKEILDTIVSKLK